MSVIKEDFKIICQQNKVIDGLFSIINDYTEQLLKKDLNKYFRLVHKADNIYMKIINKEL